MEVYEPERGNPLRESEEVEEAGSVATSLTSRDTMCPVCASELQSHGEVIRAYGEPSQERLGLSRRVFQAIFGSKAAEIVETFYNARLPA